VRNILIIFSIFLFSFTLISCSSSDNASKSTDNSSSHEFLVGTWKTSCLTQSDNTSSVYTLVFTNSERNWQRQDYLNYDCTLYYRLWSDKYNSLTFVKNISYTDGYEGYEMSFIQESLNLIPTRSSYVDYLNGNSTCGINDWKINTEKDYSGKVCFGVSNPVNGSSWYGILAIKDNNLYMTTISQVSPSEDLISRIYSKQ